MPGNLENSAVATGLEKVSFHSSPKERQCQRMLKLPHISHTKSSKRLSEFTFTFHFHALEKEMAIHSSTIAWKIPWTEEPGRLQSMGSQRFGLDWATSLSLSLCLHDTAWVQVCESNFMIRALCDTGFIHLLIVSLSGHAFSKYLSITNYISRTVLGVWDRRQ